MKRNLFVVFALVAALIAIASPVGAQSPYDKFCEGARSLAGDSIPAESPCSENGLFIVLFSNNTMKTYKLWDTVVKLDNIEELWFEAGGETAQPLSGPEAGAPNAWTELVCRGDAAIVFQSTKESGDGVTVSLDNEWGCTEDDALFIVEPWGETSNADAGCFAINWAAAADLADRLNTPNGSAWVVSENMIDHPMVVDCDDVLTRDDLGLNPNENQVSPERETWVKQRAEELLEAADMTLKEYCAQYDEPLARLLCD